METAERVALRREAFDAFHSLVKGSLQDTVKRGRDTAAEITEVDVEHGDGASSTTAKERLAGEGAPAAIRMVADGSVELLTTLSRIKEVCLQVRDTIASGALVELRYKGDPAADGTPEEGDGTQDKGGPGLVGSAALKPGDVKRLYIIPGGRGREIQVGGQTYAALAINTPYVRSLELEGRKTGDEVFDVVAGTHGLAADIVSVI